MGFYSDLVSAIEDFLSQYEVMSAEDYDDILREVEENYRRIKK